VHEIILLAYIRKQTIDEKTSRDLVKKLKSFVEIFRKIKEVESPRVRYHNKPNLDVFFSKILIK